MLVNDNAESRKVIDHCYRKHKTTLNPIVDWEDRDVWDFIKAEGIPYCSLYDEGMHRLGCIGCPMAMTHWREREFLRWPKYKGAYLRAFDKMLERRRERNREDPSRPLWRTHGSDVAEATAVDVFNWWMEYDVLPGQVNWFDILEEDDG